MLEEALGYARKKSPVLDDHIQIAEILNNLGCLSYMCGQPLAAKSYFKESLDIQFIALSESLYGESLFLGHSVSLNISITRANIGFIKLVTKDFRVAITALEAALMVSSTGIRIGFCLASFAYFGYFVNTGTTIIVKRSQ
jgi:tetratricopeptide (TPR) repeat protein